MGVVPGTLTPALSQREREKTDAALSQRERERRCGTGPSGRVADGQRRDGGAEGVIRGEHTVVAVAMPAWRRHEIGQAVEELPRRQINDAVLSRGGGLAPAARSDPLAAIVAGQRVADALGAAVPSGEESEPLEREGGPGTGAQEMLEALEVARHVAVYEGDADARVDGKTEMGFRRVTFS